tara:strand:- start:136 stop:1434 length:1299 start_codon:yes stop_codon:yes gene_type:complete
MHKYFYKFLIITLIILGCDENDDNLGMIGKGITSPPSVTLSVMNPAIKEASGKTSIVATLEFSTKTDVSVSLNFSGTSSSSDYTISSRSIIVASGSATGEITITAKQDSDEEGDETIVVDIEDVTGFGYESGTQQVTITIKDDDEKDNWGVIVPDETEWYAASDVTQDHIDLTKKWWKVAADEWGIYGPQEWWIVGKSESAAQELDKKHCDVRAEKDNTYNKTWCYNNSTTMSRYVAEGGAGLSTYRDENTTWYGYVVTMASKYPGPDETDYKVVTIHEYFHIYQHAHIYSKIQSERDAMLQKNPWWAEGGAEYMASLLYSKQDGVDDLYLKNRMERKMESNSKLNPGESIADIPYGDRGDIAYDLGSWLVAYLINKTDEETFVKKFWDDLNTEGFEGSFKKHFGKSSADVLDEFHNTFLKLPLADQLKIIP